MLLVQQCEKYSPPKNNDKQRLANKRNNVERVFRLYLLQYNMYVLYYSVPTFVFPLKTQEETFDVIGKDNLLQIFVGLFRIGMFYRSWIGLGFETFNQLSDCNFPIRCKPLLRSLKNTSIYSRMWETIARRRGYLNITRSMYITSLYCW